MTEEKENRCEVEEGCTTRFFFVTIQKEDGEEEFTAERTYFPNQDTIEECIYNIGGEILDPDEIKDHEEIHAAVNKYLEKEKRTVQIEVKSGTVVDVRNLPEGYNYEVVDRDAMEEEQ